MEDVLTDIPPPSRFFDEDLNIFTPPPPPRPTPFLLFAEPYANETFRPSLLIFALSHPSLYICHIFPKKLIGTLMLPEIPLSGNTITSSLENKSCNIYELNDTEKPVFLVSVQFPVPSERCHVVSKLLIGEKIVPERVLILDSIRIQNFRGKLSRDDMVAYKLETSLERKGGMPPLLSNIDYYPSGSVADGISAALLARCQIRSVRGTLCVSWPEFGKPAVQFVCSLLQKIVLPNFDFSSADYANESLMSSWLKDTLLDTELYT